MTLASHLCYGIKSVRTTAASKASVQLRSPLRRLSTHTSSFVTRARAGFHIPQPASLLLQLPSPRQYSLAGWLNQRRTYAHSAAPQSSIEGESEEPWRDIRPGHARARRGNEALRLVLGRPSTLKPRRARSAGRNGADIGKYTAARPAGRRASGSMFSAKEISDRGIRAGRLRAVKHNRKSYVVVKLLLQRGALGRTPSSVGSVARRLLRRGLPGRRRREKTKALQVKSSLGNASLARRVAAKGRVPIRYRQAVFGRQTSRQGRRRLRPRLLADDRAATKVAAHETSSARIVSIRRLKTGGSDAGFAGKRTRRASAARFAARLVADRAAADATFERVIPGSNSPVERHGPRHVEFALDRLLRKGVDPSRKKSELYSLLRKTAYNGRTEDVRKIVDVLVRRLQEQPNLKLYAALILVNVAGEGSAARVVHLLEEINSERLIPDSEVYHAALKALAVHPDCLLRAQIMQDMHLRWLNLTDDGWHDVAAGYMREGNIELALEHLDDMRRARVPIQPWLSDMLVFVLCDIKEISEVLRLLKQRCSTQPAAIPAGLWYYIFDTACSLMHHPTLHFIWNRRITLLNMNPTNGQSLAVLNSASRHGDVALATDVFRILSDRGFIFTTLHYELLMSAYMHPSIGDLKTALTITCIMAGARISITQSALAPILRYLRTSPKLPPEALSHCKDMVQLEGRAIPVAVINCLIEASVLQGDLASALETYKILHTLSPEGPNIDTFNSLFRGCHHAAQAAYSGLSEERAAERAEDRAALAAAQTSDAVQAGANKRKAVDAAVAKGKTTAPSAAAMAVDPSTETVDFATGQLSVNPSSTSAPAPPAQPTASSPKASTSNISTTSNPTIPTPTAANKPPQRPTPLLTPKNTALDLATEMVHLRIPPTSLTYDRLILVCLSQDDMSDALRYYREMREMGFWPRQGTFVAMVGRLWEEWGVVGRRRRGRERERERRMQEGVRGEGAGKVTGRGKERGKGEQKENYLHLKRVGSGLELQDAHTADDVASGRIGDVATHSRGGRSGGGQSSGRDESRDESGSSSGSGYEVEADDGPVDRPLERAWALISVMKERRYRTDRLEALLLGEIEA